MTLRRSQVVSDPVKLTSPDEPMTCLRHEATGRYCWPYDGEELCANCKQILSNLAKMLGEMIDRKILQCVREAIKEDADRRNCEEASRPPVKGIPLD